ncbi:MAG: hypothetical protein ABSG94_04650 [Brevinematales bacterium]
MKKLLVILAFLTVYAMGYSGRETFDDYSFLLNLYGNFGFGVSGPLMDQEVNSYSVTVLYYDGSTQTFNPSLTAIDGGISGEFLLGHFGFELSYNPIYIDENLTTGSSDDYNSQSYGGTLLSGNAFYFGINYHVPFDFRNGCGSLFFGVKGGYLTATLTPFISELDNMGETSSEVYIPLTGYSIVPHIGVDFMFDIFTFGMSLSYDIDYFKAPKDLGSYDINVSDGVIGYNYSSSTFNINYLTIDFFIGLAF